MDCGVAVGADRPKAPRTTTASGNGSEREGHSARAKPNFGSGSARIASLALFLLGLSLLAGTATAQSRSPFTQSGEVDFAVVYHFAQRANAAYESQSAITGLYPGVTRVATPGRTDVLYFIEHDHERKAATIAVRGTVDQVNWSLDEDTRGITDTKAHILVHDGFDTVAKVVYADLKPHVKPDYAVYLTGHSLGGAVAGLLAIYLHEDGYKVAGVVTFGQPKFTNEAGVAEYGHLPILRVVDQNDVVPMLPDTTQGGQVRFAHLGAELNILSGPYYAFLGSQDATRRSLDEFAHDVFVSSVPDHKIAWYLANIEDKLKGAQRVNYADRERYVVRHRKGPTQTIKPKTNYNSAD
jgi:hypothetical protein